MVLSRDKNLADADCSNAGNDRFKMSRWHKVVLFIAMRVIEPSPQPTMFHGDF